MVRCLDSGFNTRITPQRGGVLNPSLTIKNVNKELLPSINVNVIYVKEEAPPKAVEPIEWFLMTNEPVCSGEEAYEKVGYYIQRWKMARLRGAHAFILS
jgi:hypothetical protein